MNRNLAILISAIFHPVFVNLMSFVFVIQLNPYLEAGLNNEAKWFYILYVFITTSLLPLFWVVMRKALGFSKSIMLQQSQERHVPYIVAASTYLLGYYLFLRINSPAPLQAFMLGSACVLTCALIINFYTKISAHATSLGAISGVLIALNRYTENDLRLLLVAILLISGIATSSRLALDAHSRSEIYSGFGLGFFVMWLIM
jgi:hypothetical protein